MKSFFTLGFWLHKIPLITLIALFLLPIILMQINYFLGLFFIAFYISYWTIKVFHGYYHILKSYLQLLRMESYDFASNQLLQEGGKCLKHIVIVPIYTEPLDVIEENVAAIAQTTYVFPENITVILAVEARAPHAETYADIVCEKFSSSQVRIIKIVHPDGLPDEGKVKGANITYAIKTYETMESLDPHQTFVSTIDTDTRVEKNFFSIVTLTFLSTDYRDHAIYQYTPIYSNNWREGTFFARIIAAGTTFWQFFESQNPEFYRNFAVYGQSLYCLHQAEYWSKTSLVEDGLQYWRAYF